VRVWTKCINTDEFSHSNNPQFRQQLQRIVNTVALKAAQGYVPPIMAIRDKFTHDIKDVVTLEAVAEWANLQPRSKELREIDCAKRMDRTLSSYFNLPVAAVSSDKPSVWRYISPESQDAILLKLLCRI
jgi:hypothetical protein